MLTPIIRRRLVSMFDGEDQNVDLAYGALLLAQEEYPSLDPRFYLARLDYLAFRANQVIGSPSSPQRMVEAINQILFEEEKFLGNPGNYYDPRNSYLNDVIDRKLGIPITLSIVYIAVGRRLRLPVVGVGLPGHFIVAIRGDEHILVDPFHQGKILTLEDCADRVRQVYGGRLSFNPSMLATVTNREILTRVLNNLKAIFAQADDFGRLLAVIDRLLLINPREVRELRDRGAVCQQMKFYGQALADLQHYLELMPKAADAEQVHAALESIKRDLAWQN